MATRARTSSKVDVDRYAVPPKTTGTPQQRAVKARNAMRGLKAGVRVTKAMYRPGSS